MNKKDKEQSIVDFENFQWDASEISKEFSKHIHSEEPLQLILKCHLIIENMLIDFITLSLSKPDLLDLDRLNFPIKVQLALSLDALPIDFPKTFLYLNNLRNKVAHNLEFLLNDEHKNNFIETIPISFYSLIFADKDYNSKDFNPSDFSFKELLRRYLITIDLFRARYAYYEIKKREAFEDLRKALEM